jgi:hypothetical protein
MFFLFNFICKAYSLPAEIITNNSVNLKEFRKYLEPHSTQLKPIVAYRLIVNGKAENFNGKLKKIFYALSYNPN